MVTRAAAPESGTRPGRPGPTSGMLSRPENLSRTDAIGLIPRPPRGGWTKRLHEPASIV